MISAKRLNSRHEDEILDLLKYNRNSVFQFSGFQYQFRTRTRKPQKNRTCWLYSLVFVQASAAKKVLKPRKPKNWEAEFLVYLQILRFPVLLARVSFYGTIGRHSFKFLTQALLSLRVGTQRTKIIKKVHKPSHNHYIEWPVFFDIGLNCESHGEKGRTWKNFEIIIGYWDFFFFLYMLSLYHC